MGAYVSTADCESHYNITLDCTYTADNNKTHPIIGGYGPSEIPTDADIAGIGVSPGSVVGTLVLIQPRLMQSPL